MTDKTKPRPNFLGHISCSFTAFTEDLPRIFCCRDNLSEYEIERINRSSKLNASTPFINETF